MAKNKLDSKSLEKKSPIFVPNMKKLFIGKTFLWLKLSIKISAFKDSKIGNESPFGVDVAILPPIVPTFLIWTDPYLLRIE